MTPSEFIINLESHFSNRIRISVIDERYVATIHTDVHEYSVFINSYGTGLCVSRSGPAECGAQYLLQETSINTDVLRAVMELLPGDALTSKPQHSTLLLGQEISSIHLIDIIKHPLRQHSYEADKRQVHMSTIECMQVYDVAGMVAVCVDKSQGHNVVKSLFVDHRFVGRGMGSFFLRSLHLAVPEWVTSEEFPSIANIDAVQVHDSLFTAPSYIRIRPSPRDWIADAYNPSHGWDTF